MAGRSRHDLGGRSPRMARGSHGDDDGCAKQKVQRRRGLAVRGVTVKERIG
jgi:hypothetical protein